MIWILSVRLPGPQSNQYIPDTTRQGQWSFSDASFPAKRIYLKRGYKETEYNIIEADNGDCLCYDVMRLEKNTVREDEIRI